MLKLLYILHKISYKILWLDSSKHVIILDKLVLTIFEIRELYGLHKV